MKKLVMIGSVLFLCLIAATAMAQTNTTVDPATLPGSQLTLAQILPLVVSWFLAIIAFTAFLGIIYSGFILITSGGDPAKAQTAHKNIVWAVIGIIITLVSYIALVAAANLLNPDNSGVNFLKLNGDNPGGGSQATPSLLVTDPSGTAATEYTIAQPSSTSQFPIKVSLSAKPAESVSVSVFTQGELPLTLDATNLTFTSENWNQPQQVIVTYSGDGQPAQKGRVLFKIGSNQSQAVLFTAESL